ncbi:RING finger protein 17 [Anopheles cruzii]|uniref:RING finger protein 17 n=1 Tax=Anopheles cruzii TaxID=68878 RepID=UPI0022EC66C1|nr:RING finger protein 17 [Anopheles cruzii]
MANINIENLIKTDRFLTWLQVPSCARCSLPFSNNGPEDLVQRLPLLLSCHHMLCGPCVREFCNCDTIRCEQCLHETVVKDCDNPASVLNPSYYLLGSIQQAQYELENLESYRDARRNSERQEITAETVSPGETLLVSQLDSAKKVQALLEDAYHSYERSKNQLEKFDREQRSNVGSVIGKVNDYFLQLHNTLQQVQDQQLQRIRNKYAEIRRQQEDDQLQLGEVHGQLTKFLKMIKWFNDKDKKQKTSPPWLNFVQDVKTYLENEPIQLRGNSLRQQQHPFRFSGGEATLASVSRLDHGRLVSETLTVKELAKLVPFTTQSKSKAKQKRNTDSSSERKETLNTDLSSTVRPQEDGTSNPEQTHKTFLDHQGIRVLVTHIVSPQQLYVQDERFAKTAPALAELCNSEAQKYHTELEGPFTIAEGSLYLVRPVVESSFSWPAKWYRARVTRKYPPQQYLVQYIDFGHLEMVREDQIRPISPELNGFVIGAQKVSLYDVTPKVRASGTNDEWAEECRQLMVDFIANRQVVMVVLTKEGNVQSLREALHYFDLCQTVPGDRQQPKAAQRLKRWLQMHRSKHRNNTTSPRKIVQHDSFPCTIRHSTTPDNFQVMPTKWGVDILEPIQQELDQGASERAKVYAPYVGQVCAFTDQRETQGGGTGHWMRGRVTHVGVRQCELLAIDSGKLYANIAWDNIRLMAAESLTLWVAPVVVNCQLAYIRPKPTNNDKDGAGDSCQWSREAVQEFNQILASRTMQFEVTIETKPEDNVPYSVLLYLLNRKTRDTCVNGLLVQNGYAECVSPRSDLIADRVKEVIAEPESIQRKKMSGRKAGGLKPSQTVLLSDPRVPVKLLRVQSPAEFYVQRKSCKAGMEQLHHEIQEYMDDRIEEEEADAEQEQRAIGDVCVAFARAPGSASCEWYRAQVTAILEGDNSQYEMFLIDQAVSVQVHRANMARLPQRFAQIQPAAIRCKLANVKPVGGSDRWHQSSIDNFKSVACSFPAHAVLLERNHETTRELPVVLWGVRVEETGALTPRRTVYTNVNRSLVDSGYAHRIAPTEPPGGSDPPVSPPTVDDEVQTFEKAVTSQFETEYRQLQQFFRAIDDATSQTASSAKLVKSTASRDDEAWEETMRSLIDRQVMEIADWPDALPVEKSIFVGTPTHVGTDGTIYLQDESYHSVVTQMKNEIQQYVTTTTEMGDGRIKSRLLAVGDVCLARFYLDQNYYRARVTAIGKGKTYSVQFVDYGNIEQCTIDDLRCDTICCRMPVLVNGFRLHDLEPRESVPGGQWPDAALDTLHSLIVTKRCTVRVIGKRLRGDPDPRCTLHIVDGNVDVAEVLCGLQLFVRGEDKKQKKKRDSNLIVQFTNAPSDAPCRSIMDIMNEIVCDDEGIEGTDDPYAHDDGYDDNASNSDRATHSSGSSVCDPIDLLSAARDFGEPPMVDTPLPSPESFNSHEFETSSLRSSVERLLGESHLRKLGGCGSFAGFPILQFDQYQRGFYAVYTNYTDPLTLHVYPQIEGHTIRMGQMAQAIQTYVMSNNKFHKWQASLLEPQAPCLARFAEDGQFYRAVIEGCDHETREARVLFVDYLNRATVPIDTGIRKCPTAIQSIPLHNVTVRLAGVRPNPRNREDDVACQLATRLQKSFYVRLLHQTYQRAEGGLPIPLVELYTSEDYRTLVYQPLMDEKFFLTDPLGSTK